MDDVIEGALKPPTKRSADSSGAVGLPRTAARHLAGEMWEALQSSGSGYCGGASPKRSRICGYSSPSAAPIALTVSRPPPLVAEVEHIGDPLTDREIERADRRIGRAHRIADIVEPFGPRVLGVPVAPETSVEPERVEVIVVPAEHPTSWSAVSSTGERG